MGLCPDADIVASGGGVRSCVLTHRAVSKGQKARPDPIPWRSCASPWPGHATVQRTPSSASVPGYSSRSMAALSFRVRSCFFPRAHKPTGNARNKKCRHGGDLLRGELGDEPDPRLINTIYPVSMRVTDGGVQHQEDSRVRAPLRWIPNSSGTTE